ncbi:unnamed protein product [Clonostachys rosea f. rosea IK726]|uniref:Uncharacterized protein n=1 Tax=Clonostachys rosea f. rosea IK726 TaxID=1349383 RepID=A0ACA9UC10_BIOOC|nr:unnamed protein product [Clonostachys rosea f. rosea IK726]
MAEDLFSEGRWQSTGEFDTGAVPGYLNVLPIKSTLDANRKGGKQDIRSIFRKCSTTPTSLQRRSFLLELRVWLAKPSLSVMGLPSFGSMGVQYIVPPGLTLSQPNHPNSIRSLIIVALFEEFLAWAIGRHPTLTRESILFSVNDYTAKNDKARKVLGYNPPIGYEESLERSVKWCLENIEELKK